VGVPHVVMGESLLGCAVRVGVQPDGHHCEEPWLLDQEDMGVSISLEN